MDVYGSSHLKTLLWTVAMFFILFLLLEGWRYAVKPSPANQPEVVQQYLSESANQFHNRQKKLQDDTEQLAETLKNQLVSKESKDRIYQRLRAYTDFWGIRLKRKQTPYIWNGFAPGFHETDTLVNVAYVEPSVSIKKENNVIYWQFDTRLLVQEDTSQVVPYHLSTFALIEQDNTLAIGKSSEFTLGKQPDEKFLNSISYSFFSAQPPHVKNFKVLHKPNGDSAGIVYGQPADIEQSITEWSNKNWFWRSVYIVLCFVFLSSLFWKWTSESPLFPGLPIQLLIIAVGWSVFAYLGIPSRWLEALQPVNTAGILPALSKAGNFLRDGIFLFIVTFSVYQRIEQQNKSVEEDNYFSTIINALLLGIGNAVAILAIIYKSYTTISNSDIGVLDLTLFPSIVTILLYLGLGISFLALGLILFSLNRYMLSSGSSHYKLISLFVILGFLIGLFLAQLFVSDAIRLNWAFLLTIAGFLLIYFISFYDFKKHHIFRRFSTLRSLIIATTLIAALSTPVIYYAYIDRENHYLHDVAEKFMQREDPVAERLTSRLLTQLERTFRNISKNDLDNRVSFVQTEFTNAVESLISTADQPYSIDIQLIKSGGSLIADYSTDLNSPNWVTVFDIPRLSTVVEMQQITRATNRPIVQLPELRNQKDYETFYRGWIPIFGNSGEDPIAWILCSIYEERPDFDKPIRAVMASVNYEDWNNSYAMQEYHDNQLYRSATRGLAGYYPIHNELQQPEVEALQQDSMVYYTNKTSQNKYRNLLWEINENRVIKASTILPDFRNVLFAFFKLNLTLLAAGLFFTLLLYITGHYTFTLVEQGERFQNRILDNFLLATLLFMTLLIFATHFAIRQYNRDLVERELFEKLESLTSATESNSYFRQSQKLGSPFTLDSLVTPLNVDASFYADQQVTESTTSQIYQQHLLPRTLPFMVYHELYEDEKRDVLTNLSLASQELLVGYRSVLSPDNEPIAAIAIPTFAQSPEVKHQLLETISYLIVLYLIVFGLFIAGTTFIARRLTRPLRIIQQGLDRITKGELDTTIPVTSNDEIGDLAEAYNNMVYQLKETQQELAIAEREAAWKEMAQQVAHEIKNPLTPMKLNLQHLDRQLKGGEKNMEDLKPKIRKITQNLTEQIQSLNNIASDFSKFSQPIDEEFSEVKINDILVSVAELYGGDKKINIKTDFSPGGLKVYGVEDELRRVFVNLVKNAFEAMPEKGTITLRSYTKDNGAFIEVKDDGEGISEEDKSKIFVPNFSTKSSGTGLGLAISKKIIEAHNGSISFASIKGEGTTFIIKLPLE